MGWEAWYTIAVLLLTFGLLAWGKTSTAAIMWGGVALLLQVVTIGSVDPPRMLQSRLSPDQQIPTPKMPG